MTDQKKTTTIKSWDEWERHVSTFCKTQKEKVDAVFVALDRPPVSRCDVCGFGKQRNPRQFIADSSRLFCRMGLPDKQLILDEDEKLVTAFLSGEKPGCRVGYEWDALCVTLHNPPPGVAPMNDYPRLLHARQDHAMTRMHHVGAGRPSVWVQLLVESPRTLYAADVEGLIVMQIADMTKGEDGRNVTPLEAALRAMRMCLMSLMKCNPHASYLGFADAVHHDIVRAWEGLFASIMADVELDMGGGCGEPDPSLSCCATCLKLPTGPFTLTSGRARFAFCNMECCGAFRLRPDPKRCTTCTRVVRGPGLSLEPTSRVVFCNPTCQSNSGWPRWMHNATSDATPSSEKEETSIKIIGILAFVLFSVVLACGVQTVCVVQMTQPYFKNSLLTNGTSLDNTPERSEQWNVLAYARDPGTGRLVQFRLDPSYAQSFHSTWKNVASFVDPNHGDRIQIRREIEGSFYPPPTEFYSLGYCPVSGCQPMFFPDGKLRHVTQVDGMWKWHEVKEDSKPTSPPLSDTVHEEIWIGGCPDTGCKPLVIDRPLKKELNPAPSVRDFMNNFCGPIVRQLENLERQAEENTTRHEQHVTVLQTELAQLKARLEIPLVQYVLKTMDKGWCRGWFIDVVFWVSAWVAIGCICAMARPTEKALLRVLWMAIFGMWGSLLWLKLSEWKP